MFSDLIVTVDLTEPVTEDPSTSDTSETTPLIESDEHKRWGIRRQTFIDQHLNGNEPTEAAMQIIIAAIGPEPPYAETLESESVENEDVIEEVPEETEEVLHD